MMVGKEIEDIDAVMPRDAYNIGKDTPTFNVYLTVVVRDSEGKVVKVHRQRSHSPTANFIGLMLPLTYFVVTGNSHTVETTGGSTYSYQPLNNNNSPCISYPNSAHSFPSYIVMIQVGSGQQSNPYTAYSLAAPIANGSGTGQLVYGQPMIPSNVTVSGSSAYFTISQAFNNNSGGTVTITEVGIVTQIVLAASANSTSSFSGNILMWYDVLSSAISVPNGGSVTIYYTFTVNP
jgi:hypothetical protein